VCTRRATVARTNIPRSFEHCTVDGGHLSGFGGHLTGQVSGPSCTKYFVAHDERTEQHRGAHADEFGCSLDAVLDVDAESVLGLCGVV